MQRKDTEGSAQLWDWKSETGSSTCFSESRRSDHALRETRRDKESFRMNRKTEGKSSRARGARELLGEFKRRVSDDAEAAVRLL